MDTVTAIIRILIIPITLFVLAIPFIVDYLGFIQSENKKTSYMRFRVAVFSLIYAVIVTVAARIVGDVIDTVASMQWVSQVAAIIPISARIGYGTRVIAAFAVNFAIALAGVLIFRAICVGQRADSLTKPKKKDGTFSVFQRAGRAIVRYFYNERWFFVGRIFKWLTAALFTVYALLAAAFELPLLFDASWIPFDLIGRIFGAGYVFPVITLLVLWEFVLFISGIKKAGKECPAVFEDDETSLSAPETDYGKIDRSCRDIMRAHYALSMSDDAIKPDGSPLGKHDELSDFIGEAARTHPRIAVEEKDEYLACADSLLSGRNSMIINGSFYSDFSQYFLRYVSMITARGDNVIVICNSDAESEETARFIREGMAKISSIFVSSPRQDSPVYDDPVWRVVCVSGEHDDKATRDVDRSSILVTTPDFLCSEEFQRHNGTFIRLVDTVVLPDTAATVTEYGAGLELLNSQISYAIKSGAALALDQKNNEGFRARYMSRPIRYICFDDSRISGLDKLLKDLLSVDIDSENGSDVNDIMTYSSRVKVRCYDMEADADSDGKCEAVSVVDSGERLGVIMNLVQIALDCGARNVTVFSGNAYPYRAGADVLFANKGQIGVPATDENLHIDRYFNDTAEYSVVIAVDQDNNLPAAVRRYTSLIPEKESLLMIVSRPYMMREYYAANLEKVWRGDRFLRVCSDEKTLRNAAQKILVKASAGGITPAEVRAIANEVPELRKYADAGKINDVLREILKMYGITSDSQTDLYSYFEYANTNFFDADGRYVFEDRIMLRRDGALSSIISGRKMAVMNAAGREYSLPVPRERLTQNYIKGQNLLYDGEIYTIDRIDRASGVVYTHHASGGYNREAYEYVQARKYRIDMTPENITPVAVPRSSRIDKGEGECDGIRIENVSYFVFRAPAEVRTPEYYPVDPLTFRCRGAVSEKITHGISTDMTFERQTYRSYGNLKDPAYSFENTSDDVARADSGDGMLILSLKIAGNFGGTDTSDRIAALASVMLGEIIHTMFPGSADVVSVCPVYRGTFSPDEDSAAALVRQPELRITGRSDADVNDNEIELMIMEDCECDVGVINTLVSSGDDLFRDLFGHVEEYLDWYSAMTDDEKKTRGNYLYFGMDHEPECFDFASLYKVSKILGAGSAKQRFEDLEPLAEYISCDFCGSRIASGADIRELPDGRKICVRCAGTLVGGNKKAQRNAYERSRLYMTSTYGITVGDEYLPVFESTLKISEALKRGKELKIAGRDVPLRSFIGRDDRIHVETDIPDVNLGEIIVREITHLWQIKNLPGLDGVLAEGLIAIVDVQYLRYMGQNRMADVRARYYESNRTDSGEGYRRIVREMAANPGFGNNPFLCLLSYTGQQGSTVVVPPEPRKIGEGDLGLPYTSATLDRVPPSKLTYYYYDRLTSNEQVHYRILLEAVSCHEPEATVPGMDFPGFEKVMEAIEYDHPEIYWYRTFKVTGSTIIFGYGATAEECEVIDRRIEEAAAGYLKDITDEMSAYDVALRLYVKLINSVDYDNAALAEEKKMGGPALTKIDYLRSVPGVFLNGKAVCEGYARALQYLLQKCGVECAECAGIIAQGGAHAWNIVRIDGEHYFMDVTWDDASFTVQEVKNTDISFDFFNITTAELERSRKTDLNPVEIERFSATKANYYYHNDLVFASYDLERIKKIAAAAAKRGGHFFTIKCTDTALRDMIADKLCSSDAQEIIKAVSRENRAVTGFKSIRRDRYIDTVIVDFLFK